jgi:hypothetical protein
LRAAQRLDAAGRAAKRYAKLSHFLRGYSPLQAKDFLSELKLPPPKERNFSAQCEMVGAGPPRVFDTKVGQFSALAAGNRATVICVERGSIEVYFCDHLAACVGYRLFSVHSTTVNFDCATELLA